MVDGHREKLRALTETTEWRNRHMGDSGSSPAWNAGCEGAWAGEAQRSALDRRSVVSGSCWMVWCSIRASNPARFVMAVRTLRSCSNSSSSLYHCQGNRWSREKGLLKPSLPLATSSIKTYHTHTLQVHFSTPQLLPAVMAVALALRQTAEVTCELKYIAHKGAPAYFIGWHLQGDGGGGEDA